MPLIFFGTGTLSNYLYLKTGHYDQKVASIAATMSDTSLASVTFRRNALRALLAFLFLDYSFQRMEQLFAQEEEDGTGQRHFLATDLLLDYLHESSGTTKHLVRVSATAHSRVDRIEPVFLPSMFGPGTPPGIERFVANHIEGIPFIPPIPTRKHARLEAPDEVETKLSVELKMETPLIPLPSPTDQLVQSVVPSDINEICALHGWNIDMIAKKLKEKESHSPLAV